MATLGITFASLRTVPTCFHSVNPMSARFTHEDICRLPERNRKEVAAAYGQTLVGKDGSLHIIGPDPKAEFIQSESGMQQDLVNWWARESRARGIDERLLMAFPLQGARTAKNGARMKAEGARKGCPDMLLAVSRGGKGALWIENKTRSKNSRVSPEQKEFLALLAKDYAVAVCRTIAEAQNQILSYLGPTKAPLNLYPIAATPAPGEARGASH